MIQAKGSTVLFEGKRVDLIAETVIVLASCYKMLLRNWDKDEANEVFAKIGMEAVDIAQARETIELYKETENKDV